MYGSPGQSIEHSFQLFYQAASENYESFTSQPSFRDLIVSLRVMTPRVTPERLLAPLSVQLRLGEIRSLLEKLDPDTEKRIFDLCSDITRDDLAPRDCRAWAHYYLGILDLGVARRSGALSRLWEGYSNEDTSRCKRLAVANCIKNARKSFQSAIKLVGQASELLSRLSTRCFALVTGPEMEGMISAMSASMLIHKSIGSAARQAVYYALNPTDPNDQSEEVAGVNLSTKDLFGVFDSGAQSDAEREENLQSLLDELYSRTPNNWRFVAVALCPGGDILVSQLEKDCDAACFRSETVCIFPPQESANISGSLFSNHTYESILSHLDSLIKKSQQQLGGVMTAEEAAEKFKNESAKRRWWKERKRTDDELRNLIESVETKYFSTLAAHRVLYGKEESAFVADESFDSCSSDSSTFGLCGDLTSRFEAASRDDPSTPARSRRSSARDSKPSSAEEPKGNDACTILILDENFHRFPFEGMPSFVNRPVCRLPSLPFALSSLKGSLSESEASSEGPLIDPRNIRYVLDPEANLIETQERILPFIEDINAQNRWEWEGVVGEVPSKEFVEDGLTRENGLLLYCGHGGGQACFRRSQIENLMKGRSQDEGASSSTVDLPCRATVILMGCSSGKLESVNRKGTSSVANLPIFYEPEGIALSYLLAGAPCVVGNLWDVTDHDIDR